ncbi:MAG: tetratricopeptide repeat protein [Candidatus Sericytochromatia bacterium]
MALKISKLTQKPGLVITGPLNQTGFYGSFNRALARLLQRKGSYELGLIADEAHVYALEELQPLLGKLPRQLSCQIEHRSLPVLEPPAKGHWVLIQPWEYGSMPRDWQPLFRYSVDDVWVHTPSNYQAFLREGVDAERLHLIPGGLDPAFFTPEGPALSVPGAQPFCFLFTGELLWHTGLEGLLQAFQEEFLPDEPVSLLIQARSEASVADQGKLRALIEAARENPDAAPVLFWDRHLDAAEQAALYRSCQALVYPCRGEGFATQLLEAAACGLPLLLSDLEGRFELPESVPVQWLPGRLTRHHQHELAGIPTLAEPWWYECGVSELRASLRLAFEEAQTRREAAQQAAPEVQARFSWDAVAENVVARLALLAQRPIHRLEQARLQGDMLAGLEALEAGNPEKAADLLAEVLHQSPDDPLLLLDLAGIALQREQYQEALEHVARALPQAPGHVNLYHAAGIALFHLKAFALAAAYFRQTLALHPEHQGATESLPAALAQAEQAAAQDRSPEFLAWEQLLQQAPQTQRELTLSLCMIVRNEEAFLRQCLESVQHIVDEMVIVDTGSTDGTRAIAEDFGARVLDFTWTGNFAEARNQSLRAATGDWILVLDADEVVSPENIMAVKALMREPQPQPTGYQLKIRNLSQQANDVDVVEHYMMRLFPNLPMLEFKGMIHEQLVSTDPGFDLLRMATSDVLILHYGYTGEVMDSRDKFRRNLELVQRSIAEQPDHPFHWFNLGLTYRVNTEEEEALAAFQKAVALSEALPETPTYMSACYSYIISILLRLERFEEAEAVALNAPEISQETPDYWVNLGSIHNALGHYPEAIAAFRHAMQMRQQAFTAVVSDRAATTWKPYAGMGNTYLMQQDYTRADHWFRRALKENPHNAEILLGLGRLAMVRGQMDEARAYFERLLVHPRATEQQPLARFELARCDLQANQPEAAEARLRELLNEPIGESLQAAVRSELGQLFLRQQRAADAAEMLRALPQTPAMMQAMARFYFNQGALDHLLNLYSGLIAQSDAPQALDYRLRGTVYLHLQQWEAADADFEQALGLDPADAESIHNLGVIALQRGQLTEARSRFEAALQANPLLLESLLDLARLDLYAEDLPAARARLEQALRLQPAHVEVLEALAQVAQQQERLGEAGEYYVAILEQQPRHLEALTQLGYLLNDSGESARALQLFERALDLGSPSLVLYNGIGMAFLQTGRYLDARNAFLLALQLDPAHPDVQRAVQLADQLCGQAPLESAL